MATPTAQQVWSDPDFLQLHPTEKAKVMQKIDPDFSALPPVEQNKVIFQLTGRVNNAPKRTAEAPPDAPMVPGADHDQQQAAFLANEGTLGTRLRNDPIVTLTGPTAPATSIGDFIGRVAPESVGKLIPRTLAGLAQTGKDMTSPYVSAGREIMAGDPIAPALANAAKDSFVGTVKGAHGLADLITSRVGLQGYDKAKEGFLTDPAGTAAILAPVAKPLARGALQAADFAVSPVSKTAGKLASLIGDKPEAMMEQSLKQGVAVSDTQRARNIKTALEGGYLPNKAGVANLKSDIMTINGRIGETINEGRNSGKMIAISDITKPIEELKAKAIDSGADWGNNLKTLDNIVESINTNPKVVNGEIPVDVAQRWKVDVYKQLNDNVWGEFTSYAKEGRKALARGAKDAIAEALPEIANLNAKDSNLYGLQDVLERAANRIGNREAVGIGPAIKLGAGAAAGKPGMIIGGILGVIEHPSIQPRLALALYKARRGAISMAESRSIVKDRINKLVSGQKGLVGTDIEHRASGGPINPGQPYLVGEKGPEMIIPVNGGTVIPASTTEQILTAQNGGQPIDYDYSGYVAKYGKPDQSKGQHLTDEFKLPNHITFSEESKYSTPDTPGGKWVRENDGNWHYYASDYVVKQHGREKLMDYFQRNERNAILHLPN